MQTSKLITRYNLLVKLQILLVTTWKHNSQWQVLLLGKYFIRENRKKSINQSFQSSSNFFDRTKIGAAVYIKAVFKEREQFRRKEPSSKFAPVQLIFKEISSCEANNCLLEDIMSWIIKKRKLSQNKTRTQQQTQSFRWFLKFLTKGISGLQECSYFIIGGF